LLYYYYYNASYFKLGRALSFV